MDPTPDELSGAESEFAAFLQSHPGYGDASDGVRYYQAQRQAGLSHAAAMQAARQQLGWLDAPSTTTTPAPAAPAAPAGPAAATDYDFNQARAKVEQGIGRALTDADIARLFSEVGGSVSSRFDDAGIAKAIAVMKSSGAGAGPGAGGPGQGFGAPPPTYTSDPNAPQYQPLAPYQRPIWTGGDFVNPTEDELKASPGYQARLDAGLLGRNRSAAAQGIVLNGGTLKALNRYSQDYAANEYQTFRNNAYDAYKEKYSHFQDDAGLDFGARTLNANENNTTFQNRTNTYTANNSRNLSDFITNITNKRNSELDYWNRLMDVTRTGASAASGSYRP